MLTLSLLNPNRGHALSAVSTETVYTTSDDVFHHICFPYAVRIYALSTKG